MAGIPAAKDGDQENISEYAPNTFATGLYVAVFGDMSFYWVADSLENDRPVLREMLALTNQAGKKATKWTDGQPVLAEAFSRLKLAEGCKE